MPEVLVWSDDFLGAAGQAPSAAKWVHELGNYSGELEIYRNDRRNSYLNGQGQLVIAATEEDGTYYSARLVTLGLLSVFPATWQARIKFTTTAGCWPAWWLMGDPATYPDSGEIDIFEVYGVPGWAPTSTVWLPKNGVMTGNLFADFPVMDTNWHTYQLVTDSQGMHFSQDGNTYLNVAPQAADIWPYAANNPLYMILNMAVGGSGGGSVASTTFPVTMEVDWVRVYQWQA